MRNPVKNKQTAGYNGAHMVPYSQKIYISLSGNKAWQKHLQLHQTPQLQYIQLESASDFPQPFGAMVISALTSGKKLVDPFTLPSVPYFIVPLFLGSL